MTGYTLAVSWTRLQLHVYMIDKSVLYLAYPALRVSMCNKILAQRLPALKPTRESFPLEAASL